MAHLSHATDRIAIIPPPVPLIKHFDSTDNQIPSITFSLDILRLRAFLHGYPIIEWKDLKKDKYDVPYNRDSAPLEYVIQKEELGCWTTSRGFHSDLEKLFELDVSFTTVSQATKLSKPKAIFPGLAPVFYDTGSSEYCDNLPSSEKIPSQELVLVAHEITQ
ncbi:hypothetical protein FRB95_002713 [Tulasnella sp. JGI-2019a]|nr:hypothetical protein FRB95_002713 [Tulasnella sp. JGI-2019a]